MIHLALNRKIKSKSSLDHINEVDPATKFTVEGNQENDAIAFLDALVKPEVEIPYRLQCTENPCTLTNTYKWDSHHNLAAKYSVISTLTHRARTVWTRPELPNREIYQP